MTRRPFIEFKNKYLVETGTYLGEGIDEALANGFENIISYEIYYPTYLDAVRKYQSKSNVKLCFKSSVTMSDEIMQINEPMTFWLDGHWSNGNTTFDPNYFYPLLKELEVISNHPIKNHVLCIDDRRLMMKMEERSSECIGVTEDEVRTAIYKINPNYTIEYRDGYCKDDVIVAYIK